MLWLWALGAGLTAALLGGICGEAGFRRFRPIVVMPTNRPTMNALERQSIFAEQLASQKSMVETKNTALAYGALGAVLAGALGLAAGLARRSPRSGLLAALIGIVAGAVAGAGSSAALAPLFTRYNDLESGLMILFPTHAGIFMAIGAAAGLAFALGLEERRKLVGAVLAGTFGALLGTFVFEAIDALAFPLVRTLEIIPPERAPRLLVHLCVAFFTALLVGLSAGDVSASRSSAKAGSLL
jgi:hypothetical protein